MTEPKDAVTILREALQKLKLCALAVIDANNSVEAKNAVRVLNSEVIKANSTLEATERAAIKPACDAAHPVQPLVTDAQGCTRFKENSIVRHLADGKLNDLACMDFPQEDWEQLAQLIGYSLSGFGTLSYVTDETYDRAASQEVTAPASPSQPEASDWKRLADLAVGVLQRHAPPDGLSDHDALVALYGIFDGPEYRAALATPSPKPVAGEPVPLPEPAYPGTTMDIPNAIPDLFRLDQMLAYGQAREDAALARQLAPVASAQSDALTSEITPMFLAEVAMCIESPEECRPKAKRKILGKLLRLSAEMQDAKMARLRGQKGGK